MSSALMPTLMLVPTGIGCDIGGYAVTLPSAVAGCSERLPDLLPMS